MNRQEKIKFVEKFGAFAADYRFILLIRQSGLSVSRISEFRREIHDVGGVFKVVKNSLAKQALKDKVPEEFLENFKGPIAVFFGSEPVKGTKIIVDFAKSNLERFEVVCALLDKKVLKLNEIEALSKLPSLEELYVKLLSTLIAPATKFVTTLKEPARQLVCVLNLYHQKLNKGEQE